LHDTSLRDGASQRYIPLSSFNQVLPEFAWMAEKTTGLARASQGRESMLIEVHASKIRKNLQSIPGMQSEILQFESLKRSQQAIREICGLVLISFSSVFD